MARRGRAVSVVALTVALAVTFGSGAPSGASPESPESARVLPELEDQQVHGLSNGLAPSLLETLQWQSALNAAFDAGRRAGLDERALSPPPAPAPLYRSVWGLQRQPPVPACPELTVAGHLPLVSDQREHWSCSAAGAAPERYRVPQAPYEYGGRDGGTLQERQGAQRRPWLLRAVACAAVGAVLLLVLATLRINRAIQCLHSGVVAETCTPLQPPAQRESATLSDVADRAAEMRAQKLNQDRHSEEAAFLRSNADGSAGKDAPPRPASAGRSDISAAWSELKTQAPQDPPFRQVSEDALLRVESGASTPQRPLHMQPPPGHFVGRALELLPDPGPRHVYNRWHSCPVPRQHAPPARAAAAEPLLPRATSRHALDLQLTSQTDLSTSSAASSSPSRAATTLPAFTSDAARDAGRHSAAALAQALDTLHATGTPFMGQYDTLGPHARVVGGQGVVQFVRRAASNENYAIKFFTQEGAFEKEREVYGDAALRGMMPETREVAANEGGDLRCGGYAFPPCIVQERGESLEEWGRRGERDFVTSLQALYHVAKRLALMHDAGWAHLDVKPRNVLRRPSLHGWTLIDFGCSTRIGTLRTLSYSPLYAAPEIIAAVHGGAREAVADAAADVWALGVIAFELATLEPAFPLLATRAQVGAMLQGEQTLPWEAGGAKHARLAALRGLRPTVERCLSRDPARRPSAADLVVAWDGLFGARDTTPQ